MSVTWEEPPDIRDTSPGKYRALRAELRVNPNQWAVISSVGANPHTMVGQMRRAAVWSGFEIVARGKKIYARYVGDAALAAREAKS